MSRPSLNILHLASHASLHRGGAMQMLRLARGLAERGHAVTAAFNADLADFSTDDQLQRARAAGVNVIGLKLDGAQTEFSLLRELWRSQPFEVLHVHRETALLAAAQALQHEKVPCFVAQRGTVYLPPLLGPEHRLLLSRRVQRIVAVAQAVKQALVHRRFIAARKIEVVYGGVETNLFHPGVAGARLREQHGVPPGATVITLPGALIEKKGPQFFLRAAALLRHKLPGAHFWLVGSGKLESELQRMAQGLALGSSVQFLGHAGNMPEVYAASDLVVCASIKGEGLTGTLREALAMARPVVTTNCAGNTELVEEGVTGYVCKPANAESLTAAMVRAVNDAARAHALAQAGRARVLALCSEPVRSEKMEQIYLNVLVSRRNS